MVSGHTLRTSKPALSSQIEDVPVPYATYEDELKRNLQVTVLDTELRDVRIRKRLESHLEG